MPLKYLYLFFVTTYAFKRSKKSHHNFNKNTCFKCMKLFFHKFGFNFNQRFLNVTLVNFLLLPFICCCNISHLEVESANNFEQSWTILKRQDNIQQHTLQPNSKNEPNMVRIWLMDWGLQFLFWIHCTVIRLTSAVLNLKLEFM